jgi:hypothetical protein
MEHRSTEVRQDLVVLRARDALVTVRTQLINTTRGLVKSMGARLPKCSSPSFPKKVEEALPAELREALLPLVRLAEELSDRIKDYGERIEKLGREKYEHTELLRQVKGVGPLTSLAYVLTLENPDRFRKSRDVGPYVGLVPQQEDSGDSQPQLRISKAGDMMLRQLLAGSAHYILGPFGPDTDLRRYGLQLCERGGKNAKKRWDLLCQVDFRLWLTGPIAVKQPEFDIQPLPTPSLPAEAFPLPGTHQTPPDLLLYPVFDKRKASARMSHRKVVHPPSEDWVDQFDHPSYGLAGKRSEQLTELPQQRSPLLELRRIVGPPLAATLPLDSECGETQNPGIQNCPPLRGPRPDCSPH